MTLPAGASLGPYEVLASLGAGSMGEVYRAHDRRLGRDVAIKVLPPALAQDAAALTRFEREAKLLASLSHPNILTLYDVGSEAGVSFVVMELLQGENLQARIDRAPLPWPDSLDVALAVADGLEAAHANTIVHGDLKPENIFVTVGGLVKIVDFGLARPQALAGAMHTSRAPTWVEPDAGVLAGTVLYMSPEQVRGTPGDTRSDLFAFGCTLHAMLTGAPPFRGGSVGEVLAAILRDPVPALAPAHEIPAALEQVLHACLRKEPAERLQSARELRIALRAVADGAVQWSAPVAKPPRRRRGRTIDSLAILPFSPSGTDPGTEYLCDGLTDRLIDTLSKLPRLRVMALATVLRYKGRSVDPQVVGREMNVRAVLTGRAVSRGETLTLQFELVDTQDGARLWGDQHSCEVCDIQELQETLAAQISAQLRIELLQKEKKRMHRRHTASSEAFRLYLQGRYSWNKRTRDGLMKSIELFGLASQQDPSFPLAYAGLADAYSLLGGFGYLPPREAYAKSKQEALRALALDPTLAEAHAALATVQYRFDWDWSGADKSFRLAIQHNPGYAIAHHWYGVYLTLMGRFEPGLAAVDRALELDPLSVSVHWTRGYVLYYNRRPDDAIAQYQRALAIDPTFARVHVDIGLVHVQQGLHAQGIEEIRKGIDLLEPIPGLLATLGYAYAHAGDHAEAERILAELQALAKRHYVSPYTIALIHVGMQAHDAAFDWLEKSLDLREDALASLRINPRFDPLRPDPRFARLLERIGLPAATPPAPAADSS